MKKKIWFIIGCIIGSLLLLLNIPVTYARENNVNIDEILETKSYQSLSYNVKDFIKHYYEKNGIVLLTKDLAKSGEAYLNPQYIEYLDSEKKEEYYVVPSITAYTPDIASKINTKFRNNILKASPLLPNAFDLRNFNDKNYVTPNKNQGNEGLCWAYATASLLETHDLIVKDKSYDNSAVLFSEKQMDYALSSNGIVGGTNTVMNSHRYLGDGGEFIDVEKMLSLRLIGVEDNWNVQNGSLISQNKPIEPNVVFNRNNVIYEVGETTRLINLNSDLNNVDYNEAIKDVVKNAVYNYGGALISITVGNNHTVRNILKPSDYINVTNSEYASNNNGELHALHIIGWDDDYEYSYCSNDWNGYKYISSNTHEVDGEIVCNSLTNITTTKVTGKGAWILKNSWGSEYSYLYLTYDSFIDGVVFVNNYSEKNWNNSYDLNFTEIDYSGNYLKFIFDFKKYGNFNNETVEKIKFNMQSQGSINIYYSNDGDDDNFTFVGNYNFDYAGYKEVNLASKNIIINSNAKFKLDSAGVTGNLEVFTVNNDLNPAAYTSDFTYTLENEKPSDSEYLNILTQSYVKNISDDTEITYKIKDDNNNYLPNDAYSVNLNKTYYGMVTPKIELNAVYAQVGTYYLDTFLNDNLLYTSDIILEIDFMPIFGSGTNDDPWQIENLRHFNMMRNANKDNYILINDLDFDYDTRDPNGLFYNDGYGWSEISFSGNFNGNNKTLRNIRTSSGLFGNVYVNNECKFDVCGIHDLNVDNVESNYAKNDKGGVFNSISVNKAYNANFNNISATNIVFNSNVSRNLGGIVGHIDVNDYSGDWNATILKINNWYSDVLFKGIQRPQGFNTVYLGGLIGKVQMYGGVYAYFSINNAKTNVHYNINNDYSVKYYISDIIGTIDNSNSNVDVNNVIGNVSYEHSDNADININAFVGSISGHNGTNKINGVKSTLNYTPNSTINITNYEAGLKPYELARANYDGIAYYEDQYYVYDTSYDNTTKVEFKDQFNIFNDQIPTLKNFPENYTKYHKVFNINLNETKSIDDLMINDTGYHRFMVYNNFTCNLDLCHNVTDETIISIPTEENGYTFKGLKNGSTTLIIYDTLSGYLDPVTIIVLNENQRSITFDSDGGSSVATQIVNYNETVSKPHNPTKEGYSFVEWQLNDNTYNFDTPVTDNIILKALWGPRKKYTISFHSDGDINIPSQEVLENDKVTEPTVPIRIGYLFGFWTLNNNYFSFITPITEDITLEAYWIEMEDVVITFDSNGGSSIASQTIKYHANATRPTNPTREGYIFKEWQLNGNTFDFNDNIGESITLVALWEKDNTIVENKLIDILQENNYYVSNGYVSKFNVGDTIAQIKSKLGNDIIIEASTSIISTGTVIKKGTEIYTVVIKGDLSGDGKINSGDLLQMRKYLLEENILNGAYKEAGIIESVGNIKSLDLLRLRQYLLGEYIFK